MELNLRIRSYGNCEAIANYNGSGTDYQKNNNNNNGSGTTGFKFSFTLLGFFSVNLVFLVIYTCYGGRR